MTPNVCEDLNTIWYTILDTQLLGQNVVAQWFNFNTHKLLQCRDTVNWNTTWIFLNTLSVLPKYSAVSLTSIDGLIKRTYSHFDLSFALSWLTTGRWNLTIVIFITAHARTTVEYLRLMKQESELKMGVFRDRKCNSSYQNETLSRWRWTHIWNGFWHSCLLYRLVWCCWCC